MACTVFNLSVWRIDNHENSKTAKKTTSNNICSCMFLCAESKRRSHTECVCVVCSVLCVSVDAYMSVCVHMSTLIILCAMLSSSIQLIRPKSLCISLLLFFSSRFRFFNLLKDNNHSHASRKKETNRIVIRDERKTTTTEAASSSSAHAHAHSI